MLSPSPAFFCLCPWYNLCRPALWGVQEKDPHRHVIWSFLFSPLIPLPLLMEVLFSASPLPNFMYSVCVWSIEVRVSHMSVGWRCSMEQGQIASDYTTEENDTCLSNYIDI